MLYDVISAIHKGDYKIELTFDDGKKGIIDFSKYLLRGGVFDIFKDFSVNNEIGMLTWQNDIDIAPETLYSKATGCPLLKWMKM
jgi:hypothetical protein